MANAGAILGGAGSGALAGSALGPWGALGGGLLGGALGLFGGNAQEDAAAKQRAALDAAMARLQAFSKQQYANRMEDLQKTMAFYDPAQHALQQLYGRPGSPGAVPLAPGAAPAPAGQSALAGLIPGTRADLASRR